jgi:NADPH2:quinone reductase
VKAAFYTRTGPAADVLSVADVPTPVPGDGEVRVKLACSGVNPSDVKTRGGLRPMAFPRIIPHSDGAGTIDLVGGSVDPRRAGERVWLWNGQWQRADGTAAEFIVVRAEQAVRLPDAVSFEAGACLGIPALTAWHAVTMDGGVAGKTVLVAGGAGAVGHYAVQIAKLQGARLVIATVSGPEKAALASAAGADAVLNYRSGDLVSQARDAAGGKGVERVIEVDLAANVAADVDMLAPEGDIVVYGSGAPQIPVPFLPLILKNVRLRFFIVYNLAPGDRAAAVAGLNALLESGRLSHNVAARLPLDAVAEAHELVERGAVAGNVVIHM